MNEANLDRGTYEIIRDRLMDQAKALGEKAEDLNRRRLELFGSSEVSLVGNERIRTENNCVPRDIVAVGSRLLFGYNVFIGLRRETKVRDVLTLHRFGRAAQESGEDFVIEALSPEDSDNFLSDPRFVEDFAELYRYYKDAHLLQLRNLGSKLLAVFQIGESTSDVRVFRWAVDREGKVSYIDNRGERDHTFPPSHDFEWTPVAREDFISGRHPHISILDEVFVETVGGDLT
ncbi:MAG TPA: DNA repair ATPase, partial [Acidobacteriota bacterium]|nr:DNA repair ATPase [Acidobacteriota bacterium]